MFRAIQRAREEESGFTLIELLIVIVILGILAGVVIFSVGGVTDTGDVAACKTDVKTISVAIEAYKAKTGGFPALLDPDVTNSDGNNADTQFLRAQPELVGNVLTQKSYSVTYDPTTGGVDAGRFC
jgi:prepilin-type N-terminal cleavage/methylation domain-containing protein